MSELHGPFEPLEPPPGGLDRLRERIDRERRARGRRRAAIPVAAAAALAFTALVWLRPPEPRPALPGWETSPLRMRLGLVDPPADPVTIPRSLRTELAARRVPLDTDRVVFYLIGGTGDGLPPDFSEPPRDLDESRPAGGA